MRIFFSLNNIEKKEKVSFKGLTASLQNKAYDDAFEISSFIANKPKATGIVGNIPCEWINKVSKTSRKEIVKAFYIELGKVISEFRGKTQFQKDQEIASSKLNSLMRNSGFLLEDENICLSKLDHGDYGTAFILKSNKRRSNYLIKIFHYPSRDLTEKHKGTYVEINRAAFWNRQAGKNTNRPTFYFADIKNGYIVTKYIDDESMPPKKVVLPESLGLFSYDETSDLNGLNKINGYSVDYGGMMVISALAKNKTARYIYKKLYNTDEKERMSLFNSFLSNKKAQNYSDRLIGLACSLDLLDIQFEKGFFKLSKIPDIELKKVLITKLKGLSDESTFNGFKDIAIGANNEVKTLLSKNIFYLAHNERVKGLKILASNADDILKESITKSFIYIHDEIIVKELQEYLKNNH